MWSQLYRPQPLDRRDIRAGTTVCGLKLLFSKKIDYFLSLVFNIYFQMDYDVSWLKRRCIDIHIEDYIQQIEKEDGSGADNLDTETLSGISVYTVI